ncbi:hypothetical protein GCM10009105_19490 [Dokdonella soli]|uniref:Uncharacterized protein n=1 Tax=Dokdonella soli TaxID=529810 RepID=A0ABN1IIS5_9GAMM
MLGVLSRFADYYKRGTVVPTDIAATARGRMFSDAPTVMTVFAALGAVTVAGNARSLAEETYWRA